jgi:hypothetical protein
VAVKHGQRRIKAKRKCETADIIFFDVVMVKDNAAHCTTWYDKCHYVHSRCSELNLIGEHTSVEKTDMRIALERTHGDKTGSCNLYHDAFSDSWIRRSKTYFCRTLWCLTKSRIFQKHQNKEYKREFSKPELEDRILDDVEHSETSN